jgi:hypothetical protein
VYLDPPLVRNNVIKPTDNSCKAIRSAKQYEVQSNTKCEAIRSNGLDQVRSSSLNIKFWVKIIVHLGIVYGFLRTIELVREYRVQQEISQVSTESIQVHHQVYQK